MDDDGVSKHETSWVNTIPLFISSAFHLLSFPSLKFHLLTWLWPISLDCEQERKRENVSNRERKERKNYQKTNNPRKRKEWRESKQFQLCSWWWVLPFQISPSFQIFPFPFCLSFGLHFYLEFLPFVREWKNSNLDISQRFDSKIEEIK